MIFTQTEQRMLQMFQFTVWQKIFQECGFSSLTDGINMVKRCLVLCNELIEILKPSTVHEGVKYLIDKKADIFFVTLNKSDKDYSPTTMYNDYSINDSLFRWQSQSTTADTSVTGKRYIDHKGQENKEGSKPMNITWRLHKPIPAKITKISFTWSLDRMYYFWYFNDSIKL